MFTYLEQKTLCIINSDPYMRYNSDLLTEFNQQKLIFTESSGKIVDVENHHILLLLYLRCFLLLWCLLGFLLLPWSLLSCLLRCVFLCFCLFGVSVVGPGTGGPQQQAQQSYGQKCVCPHVGVSVWVPALRCGQPQKNVSLKVCTFMCLRWGVCVRILLAFCVIQSDGTPAGDSFLCKPITCCPVDSELNKLAVC